MGKPLPGLDVPVLNPTGQMNQAWFEYFQSLQALVKVLATPVVPTNTSASRLIGNPTGSPAIASEISLGFGLAFSGTSLVTRLTTSLTSALGADVALNNIANYFDGPSVAQGTTGTWLVCGTVTVIDTVSLAAIHCKLWDGTTVIASSAGYSDNTARGVSVSLAGIITSPAGNLKISCRDADHTTGNILFNETGNSKDSNITAVRLA